MTPAAANRPVSTACAPSPAITSSGTDRNAIAASGIAAASPILTRIDKYILAGLCRHDSFSISKHTRTVTSTSPPICRRMTGLSFGVPPTSEPLRLQVEEFGVASLGRQQLLVAALLDHPTPVDDDDGVGAAHTGEPV